MRAAAVSLTTRASPAKAAILDKQTAAKVAEAISQVAQDYAAQNAAIDHLRGMSRDES